MPSYNIVYEINNNNSRPAVVVDKLYYWFDCKNTLHNRTNESLWRSCNIFPMINPTKYRKFALKFMLQELHSITAHSTCSGNIFSRAFKIVCGHEICVNKEHRLVQLRFH